MKTSNDPKDRVHYFLLHVCAFVKENISVAIARFQRTRSKPLLIHYTKYTRYE